MEDPASQLLPEDKLVISLCRPGLTLEQKPEIEELIAAVTNWDNFVNLSNDHGVIALCRHNIIQTGNSDLIPVTQLKTLNNAYLRNLARNTYLYNQLTDILGLIRNEEIKVVLLKGIALEKTIYGNNGLRQMSDIDILVAKDHIAPLKRILTDHGYISAKWKSGLYKYLAHQLNTHIPRLSKDDCHIEIHSRLFDQRDNSLTLSLFESSSPVDINGCTAYIPPPQLFFLYLVSHLSYHMAAGELQLRMYADLLMLLSFYHNKIINEQLLTDANKAGIEKELASTLFIMRHVWGLEFPPRYTSLLSQQQYESAMAKFITLVKEPKIAPREELSSKYIRQMSNIKGIPGKILYISGFLFPSLSFMKKRYGKETFAGALLYYPVRWFQTLRYLVSGK